MWLALDLGARSPTGSNRRHRWIDRAPQVKEQGATAIDTRAAPARRRPNQLSLLLRPVVVPSLAGREFLRVTEAGRHRGVGAGHVLVVVDAQQPDPALLAEGQGDEATKLDEFGLGEVLPDALPQLVEVLLSPGDRLGVRERGLLAVVVLVRRLEVQQLVVLRLLEAGGRCLDG